ncbi:unnamed protein product [Merluccius merluccius]
MGRSQVGRPLQRVDADILELPMTSRGNRLFLPRLGPSCLLLQSSLHQFTGSHKAGIGLRLVSWTMDWAM